jgi:hypothetical protein
MGPLGMIRYNSKPRAIIFALFVLRDCCSMGYPSLPSNWLNVKGLKPYCVVKTGNSSVFMTGGGFHLPVNASDFGA